MILFVHITLALAATASAAASLSTAHRGKTYGMVSGGLLIPTLVSGGILAVVTPAAFGQVCLSGTIFSVLCVSLIAIGAMRRNRALAQH